MRLVEESSLGRRRLQTNKTAWSRGVWRGGLVALGVAGCAASSAGFLACGGGSSGTSGDDTSTGPGDAGDASTMHVSDDSGATGTMMDAGVVPVDDAGTGTGTPDAAKTPTYTISGTITGYSGSGLVLENNAGDDLMVTSAGASTPFTFATSVEQGQMYTVAVKVQPGMPSETCNVTNASGTATADVSNVTIACTVNTYDLGLTVTGLVAISDGGIADAGPADSGFLDAGDGGTVPIPKNALVLTDTDGDILTVSADGMYNFPSKVPSGAMFDVEIAQQPIYPQASCSLSGNTGMVQAGDVSTIAVNCTPASYTLGGNVTTNGTMGVTGLVLDDGAGHKATINSTGTFSFPIPLDSGQLYNVTVTTEPTGPTQTCQVTNGGGTITGAPVTNVGIACTVNTYNIGYAVTGLAAGQSLTLNDKYNGTTNDTTVTVTSTGAQSGNFAHQVASGSTYAVTAKTVAATPQQTCSVGDATTPGSGTVGGADVSVPIACTTSTYTVGGSVAGLPNGVTMTIQDNGGDAQTLTGVTGNAAVPFTFATAVASGSTYSLKISAQPTGNYCTFVNGSGKITTANVTNLAVTCRPQEAVAVLFADPTNSADVIASLTGTNAFASVTGIDYLKNPPTLATLQKYTAVLVYSATSFDGVYDAGNEFKADSGVVTLSNLLAQYITTIPTGSAVPGRVVTMAETDISGHNELTGGFSSYSAIALGNAASGPDGLNKVDVATTSLTSGVAALNALVAIHGTGGLANGGVKVAEWGDGTPLVASVTYKIGTGTTVYNRADLNFYPVSSNVNANFWTGDGAQLMVNALLYR